MSEWAKLQWRCRRGTLELDLLMMRYLKEIYPSASGGHQHAFQRLLTYSDDLLQDLFTGKVVPQDKEIEDVVEQICATNSNSS